MMHKYYLNQNNHQNPHLQRAWNKYGPDNFEFIVVEEVSPDKLLVAEQKYLDMAKLEQNKYYNISFDASAIFLGRKHSEETKRKMREKCVTEEHKRNISNSLKGPNNPNFGKHFTKEHRRKISESRKGQRNRLGK
jgi:group I intron endonuclease